MKGKGNYKNSKFSGFLRYSGNKMSDEERNAFEKELQKDPFAEEAAEGFESVTPNTASKDMAYLQKRLKIRTTGMRNFPYYRIAASVAVLMVISTIYFIVERDRTVKNPAVKAIQSEPLEIAENKPISEPAVKDKPPETTGQSAEKKSVQSAVVKIRTETSKEAGNIEDLKIAAAPAKDLTPEIKVNAAEGYAAARQVSAPLSVRATSKSASGIQIKGQVFSSEDNLPVPGASVFIKGTSIGVVTDKGGNFNITLPDSDNRTLVASFIGMKSKDFEAKADTQLRVRLDPSVSALSEMVTVGYGAGKAVSKKEDDASGYIPPQPVNGQLNFDRYIEKNLKRPDTTTSGQRVVVVVSFIVRTDGRVDSIGVVRSPGKLFSDEAIRLIKSGPSWNPAKKNGIITEDKVRVRILFR